MGVVNLAIQVAMLFIMTQIGCRNFTIDLSDFGFCFVRNGSFRSVSYLKAREIYLRLKIYEMHTQNKVTSSQNRGTSISLNTIYLRTVGILTIMNDALRNKERNKVSLVQQPIRNSTVLYTRLGGMFPTSP